MTASEYILAIFALVDYLEDTAITPNSAGSDISTRYITSKGNNEEEWIANLKNKTSGKVNHWLISFLKLKASSEQSNAIGTIDKPIELVLDFFYNYRQGLNYDADTETTNSEREFMERLLAVDYFLEQKRNCLPNGIQLLDWEFNIRLKPFTNDTTHWAQGVLKFRFDGIILP